MILLQVWKLLHRHFKAELTDNDYGGLISTTSMGGAHLEVPILAYIYTYVYMFVNITLHAHLLL
jgi:hypothetical protein